MINLELLDLVQQKFQNLLLKMAPVKCFIMEDARGPPTDLIHGKNVTVLVENLDN